MGCSCTQARDASTGRVNTLPCSGVTWCCCCCCHHWGSFPSLLGSPHQRKAADDWNFLMHVQQQLKELKTVPA